MLDVTSQARTELLDVLRSVFAREGQSLGAAGAMGLRLVAGAESGASRSSGSRSMRRTRATRCSITRAARC